MADDPRPGGLIMDASGGDSVLIWLRPGEHFYGPDGRLLLAAGTRDDRGGDHG